MSIKIASLTIVALALVACNSGQSTDDQQSSNGDAPINTVQVERMTAYATVQSVDPTAGMLTLQWSDTGRVNTYRAGPNVSSLRNLQAGDVVKASVAEELGVYIGPDAANPNSSGGNNVRLVPSGDSSALVIGHTYVLSERIIAIDFNNRTVTVQPPNTGSRTLKLTPNLDMSQLRVGEMVVMRVSEAIAMVVEEQ